LGWKKRKINNEEEEVTKEIKIMITTIILIYQLIHNILKTVCYNQYQMKKMN
jgi:hypothetical protein